MTGAPRESSEFRSLTGMRDVLAPETQRRRALVHTFARVVQAAGYAEIVPPLVEDLGVFLRVGESTDVVTKEMYDFTDKDGRRIALRPEITAGVVRAFVQHRPPLPWKVWYSGSNFRHEKPQKGRYRSFDQVGVEVLGVDDPDLDVEVIALAWRFFASLGLRQVELLVNSLGEHDDRARYAEALRTYLTEHSAELSEQAVGRRWPATRCASSTRSAARTAPSSPAPRWWPTICPTTPDRTSNGCAPDWMRSACRTRSTPELVRGLDYYRRTTFEFAADALDAAQNAIGGGGRYDGLAEDLGGPPTDGIGFALGVDRILLACDAEGVFAAEPAAARRLRRGPRRGRRGPRHHPRAARRRLVGRPSLRRRVDEGPDEVGRPFRRPYAVIVGSDELDAGRGHAAAAARP